MPILFLVSGSTWTVPADWNSASNTIEAIGCGGNGGGSSTGPGVRAWGGGGGGAYTRLQNLALTPGSTVNIQIAAGGSESDTFLQDNSNTTVVLAKGGTNPTQFSPGSGGQSAQCIPALAGHFGGNGGGGDVGTGGGGGGGSAGPLDFATGGSGADAADADGAGGGGAGGDFASGGNSGGGGVGGDGGLGPQGDGAGAGASFVTPAMHGINGGGGGGGTFVTNTSGAAGGSFPAWDVSHGQGGGGGGGGQDALASNVHGGDGGIYGGGGGGAGQGASGTAVGGNGGQGILVITYTSKPVSLEVKLRTAALAYPALVALLSNSPSVPNFPDFRWYNIQLLQGTKFPAIVVQLISGGQSYTFNSRLSTSYNRVQFTIWDTDSDRGRQVEQVLYQFLDVFNPAGLRSDLTGAPNFVVLTRAGMYPTPNPPQFWRTNDVQIFDNSAVS